MKFTVELRLEKQITASRARFVIEARDATEAGKLLRNLLDSNQENPRSITYPPAVIEGGASGQPIQWQEVIFKPPASVSYSCKAIDEDES